MAAEEGLGVEQASARFPLFDAISRDSSVSLSCAPAATSFSVSCGCAACVRAGIRTRDSWLSACCPSGPSLPLLQVWTHAAGQRSLSLSPWLKASPRLSLRLRELVAPALPPAWPVTLGRLSPL